MESSLLSFWICFSIHMNEDISINSQIWFRFHYSKVCIRWRKTTGHKKLKTCRDSYFCLSWRFFTLYWRKSERREMFVSKALILTWLDNIIRKEKPLLTSFRICVGIGRLSLTMSKFDFLLLSNSSIRTHPKKKKIVASEKSIISNIKFQILMSLYFLSINYCIYDVIKVNIIGPMSIFFIISA